MQCCHISPLNPRGQTKPKFNIKKKNCVKILRLRLFGSKTFLAFSDVWGVIKPWSTENVCSLTGKSLTKFKKTVYRKIFRKPFSKKFHASFVLRIPRSKPLFSPSMSFVSLAAIPLPSHLFLAVVMTGVTM